MSVSTAAVDIYSTHCLVPLKKDHSTALVTGRKIVPGMVKLNGRNDVRW